MTHTSVFTTIIICFLESLGELVKIVKAIALLGSDNPNPAAWWRARTRSNDARALQAFARLRNELP